MSPARKHGAYDGGVRERRTLRMGNRTKRLHSPPVATQDWWAQAGRMAVAETAVPMAQSVSSIGRSAEARWCFDSMAFSFPVCRSKMCCIMKRIKKRSATMEPTPTQYITPWHPVPTGLSPLNQLDVIIVPAVPYTPSLLRLRIAGGAILSSPGCGSRLPADHVLVVSVSDRQALGSRIRAPHRPKPRPATLRRRPPESLWSPAWASRRLSCG